MAERQTMARVVEGPNALNLLRLVFAGMVLIDHSWLVPELGEAPKVAALTLGQAGVIGFFAISGFVITHARMNATGRVFALRRAARLMPGLVVCLAVTAFVVAPLLTLRAGEWDAGDAWRYVFHGSVTIGGDSPIGSTMSGFPAGFVLNSPLWSLPIEVGCYILVGLGLSSGIIRRHPRSAVLGLLVGLTILELTSAAPGLSIGFAMPFFAAGSLIYVVRDHVAVAPLVAIGAVIAMGVTLWSPETVALAAMPTAYLILWGGAVIPEGLARVARRNDVSYGVYIYGWPVQLLLAAAGVGSLGVAGFVGASFAAALLLAWVSWLLVEQPVIRWAKRRTTGPAAACRGDASEHSDFDDSGGHGREPSVNTSSSLAPQTHSGVSPGAY